MKALSEFSRFVTKPLRGSSWWRLYRAHGLRHRPRGPLDGPHNEWSVIRTVTESPPRHLVDLALRAVGGARDWPLASVSERLPERKEIEIWPGEHYRLLPALAQEWGALLVVEIGTYRGASALALATAPSVERIVTFDIAPWDSFAPTYFTAGDFGTRLEQRLGDLSEPSFFSSNEQLLQSADLIFIDAPKNGIFEPQFLKLLFATPPTTNQLLVFDDIRVLTMIELWRDLELPSLDLTSFGHWSGTGIVHRAASAQVPA